MRHRRSALALMTVLIILVACLPVSSSAAKTYTGTINKDRIFFRTGPSTSSGWSTRFMKGDKVELLAVEGDFYKVKFNNKTGYVMQKFVNVSASAAAALKSAAKATAAFHPRYLIMSGIAAGIGEKSAKLYGDVIVPDMIWDYSTGKYVGTDESEIRLLWFFMVFCF